MYGRKMFIYSPFIQIEKDLFATLMNNNNNNNNVMIFEEY